MKGCRAMNDLRLEVGEKFEGKRSHVRMEIIGIERDEAVIREMETGRTFHYCLDALKRCEMVRIKEGT